MAEPPLLTLRGVQAGFGGPPLFSDVDVQIGRGDRICLVGRNGTGKSTLLKLIVGELEADDGERFVQPGVRVAYLPQEPVFDPAMSVLDYARQSGQPDHAVEAALDQLVIDGARTLGSLSGGEGRRAALARAFAGEPDILLLDEPTNHLDLATVQWLERRLRGWNGGLLLISHDRAFLRQVGNVIWWLERRQLRQVRRGFDAFDDWSEEILQNELRAAERLEARIAEETRWLLRGITARRRRNQGRLRKLEDMRRARAALLGDLKRAKITAEEGEVKSKLVVEANRIGKSFADDDGETMIVKDFSTRILRGDRIGILGPNGAGKTTLLKLLTGELPPDTGKIRLAKHLNRAYFDQHRTALDREKTLWDILCPGGGDSVMVHGRQRHVRAYLKDFLFDPMQAESPVAGLSGGERNRLMLARILATPSDLLILDEPTNDLDMDTLDLLRDMLADYPGTLLLVSHDRDFLDQTVTSTIAMEGNGAAVEYAGGYSDYLAQRKTRPASRMEARPKDGSQPKPAPTRRPRVRSRLSYKDQHEYDRLPAHIETLEREIAALEETLDDPDLYRRDPRAFEVATERLSAAQTELSAAETRWLELDELQQRLEGAAQ